MFFAPLSLASQNKLVDNQNGDRLKSSNTGAYERDLTLSILKPF